MDDEKLEKLKKLKWDKECSKYMKWIRYHADDGQWSYEFTQRKLYIYDVEDSEGDNPYYKAEEKMRPRHISALTVKQTNELHDAIIKSANPRPLQSSSSSDSDFE